MLSLYYSHVLYWHHRNYGNPSRHTILNQQLIGVYSVKNTPISMACPFFKLRPYEKKHIKKFK